jgi:hypothetical protein
MNSLRSLELWDRGFEINSRRGYLYAFIISVVLHVCGDLRMADPQSKASYRLCLGLRNRKAAKVQRRALRAIDLGNSSETVVITRLHVFTSLNTAISIVKASNLMQ